MQITIPNEIIEKIKALPKPALIAIGGFGGSGKSSLAAALQKFLPSAAAAAVVVPIDDFIVKEKILDPWDKGAFDRTRLEEQVLKPLSEGRQAKYQALIWETNTLSDFMELPKADVVIVEGISSYHPDIAHYYDLKIWVETPIAIAKERGRARAGESENAKHWGLWARNDLAYKEQFHPEQIADITFVNG
ncbi:MAG TPA: hypothetical protein VLF69_06280 [Candidatus Saccharimonadales bacterium]|nr:hypothetical protein [Candidatus Saccharimonadales bacterium]